MTDTAITIEIPPAMQEEHSALHAELQAAARAHGRVGEAAREVARLLHPHFLREEEIALPPLGLLREIAGHGVDPSMAAVLPLTDALEAELPAMLDEHRALREALQTLSVVAEEEERPELADLAQKVRLHAAAEEQVTYPAALLVGRHVRLALQRG